MFRHLLPSAVILTIAAAPIAGMAAQTQFKSVHIDLPDSDKMFSGGSASDTINNNCLACHSADMVLNQPAMPREAWKSVVEKMIHSYKAPIAAEDVEPIVDYLAALKGTK